jgi:quinol monooxygenase YgiN
MSVARHYVMSAVAGKEDEFLAAVREVCERVSKCDGYEGYELFKDIENPTSVVLIERWVSPEAHQKGRDSMPPGNLDRVSASRIGVPTASYLGTVARG